MMLLLLVEIYTSFILFLLLSYCESIKTTFTSGIKGVVSLSPSTITTTSLLPSPAITTKSSSSSTSSSLSISHDATYFTGAGIYLFWQMVYITSTFSSVSLSRFIIIITTTNIIIIIITNNTIIIIITIITSNTIIIIIN